MTNVFNILEERGYIEQMTHPTEIKELFGKESVPFYIGIDPTADSLHVGHFVSLMGCKSYAKMWTQTYHISWWWNCNNR